MASTDARPVPQKNVAYRHYFSIRKNDGTLITTWAGQDSELSQDGGTFADATNEATEIATTSGCGYIDLTSTEMNNDSVMLKVTVTNADALTYVVALFPEEAGDIRANITQISDDATAATNAESFFDGTGYAGTNNVIPTVTTLTGHTAQTADHAAGIADIPTVAEFNARSLASADYTIVSDLGTVQTGDGFAYLGTNLGSLGVNATEAGGTGDHLTAIDLPNQTMDITGNITGNVSGTVGSVTGNVGGIAGTITTLDGLDTAQDAQHAATQASVNTAQADLDIITGVSGVNLLTATQASIDAIEADTNELQSDDTPATLATLATAAALTTVDAVVDSIKVDTAAILIDTNELQSDDVPTTLASLATAASLATVDTVVDAIKVDTGSLASRVTSTLFSGITSLAEWLGAMAGSQSADGTATVEIRATGAGSGGFNATTDSLEAARGLQDSTASVVNTVNTTTAGIKTKTDQLAFTVANQVDANALTGGGGGTAPTVAQIRAEMDSNSTQLAAIVADTNELQTDDIPTTLAGLATAANLATVDTVVDGIQTDLSNATDGLGALKVLIDAIQTAVDAQNDIAAADVWTAVLTEAYRSADAAGTGSQIMYEILAHLGEFAIAGTTKTLRKLDGTTTAKTFTLNDANTPTGITEAT